MFFIAEYGKFLSTISLQLAEISFIVGEECEVYKPLASD